MCRIRMDPARLSNCLHCGDNGERRALFRILAKTLVVLPDEFTKFLHIVEKVLFPVFVLIDLLYGLTYVAYRASFSFEIVESACTITLYFLASTLLLFVVTYSFSSSGMSCLVSFLSVLSGNYNYQWSKLAVSSGGAHHATLSKYSEGNRTKFKRDELVAAAVLSSNNLVDANLEFACKIIVHFPLALMKLMFAFITPFPLCSIRTGLRSLIVVWGILGLIKAVVRQDFLAMKYQKCLSFLYAFDSRNYMTFVPVFPEEGVAIHSFIFQTIGISYRLGLVTFCFMLGWWIGLLNIALLLLSSTVEFMNSYQVYQNPPIGVSTKMYTILEVFLGVFATRTSKISSERFSGTTAKLMVFYIMHLLEHFVLLYACINLFWYAYPGHNFNEDTRQRFNSTQCSELTYDSFVSTALLFTPQFAYTAGFMQAIWHLSIFFFVYCTYALIYSIYLYRAELNDDSFPAAMSIHLYCDQILDKNWYYVSRDWILKLFYYSIVPTEKLEHAATVRNLGVESDTWVRLFLQEILALEYVPTYETVKKEVGRRYKSRPFYLCLEQLVTHAFDEDGGPPPYYFNQRSNRILRSMCYIFCTEFKQHMENMDSHKIKLICELLGESPVIISDFVGAVEKPNYWLWHFK